MSDNGSNPYELPEDASAHVDISTFEQILEMDDGDDDREFSSGLVAGFFDQAATTFDEMDASLKSRDLPQLSALGHFLKGSSATLGIYKVRDSCEKIQHLGQGKDETGHNDIDDDEALDQIRKILVSMKKDYADAKEWLKNFFGEAPEDE